jgi:DNA gyrase subunit A
MGRTSYGVRGIKLLGDDRVVGVVVARGDAGALITGCENGYGKRTLVAEYPIKGRGGQGVIDIKTDGRNGPVVGVSLVRDGDEVLLITLQGQVVRTAASDISLIGRNTQGVRLIGLREGDKLVGLESVSEADLEHYAAEARPARVAAAIPDEEFEDDSGEEDEVEPRDADEE